MTNDLIIVRNTLNSISKNEKTNSIKNKLYSILVTVLLSRTVFKRNDDISVFLKSNDIDFKDYVYRSRTLIMSRVIRIVHDEEDKEKIIKWVDSVKALLYTDDTNTKKIPTSNENPIDDLLKRFGRK